MATSQPNTLADLDRLRPAKNRSYIANPIFKQQWLDLVTPGDKAVGDAGPILKRMVTQMLDVD